MDLIRPAPPWKPPHLGWLAGLVTTWALLSLYVVSDGAISVSVDMPVIYVGGALSGMATLGFTIAGSINRVGPPRQQGRRWPWLLSAVTIIAIVPSLCRYNIPLKARLALSRQALLEAARTTARNAHAPDPRWIGYFHVNRVDTVGSTTRFLTGSCGLADQCGVAHSPDGEPPGTRQDRYQKITGPWWSFVIRN